MTANIAAKPTQKAGEAAAHVQAVSYGGRPKAVAVDFVRLYHSPSTRKDAFLCLLPRNRRCFGSSRSAWHCAQLVA